MKSANRKAMWAKKSKTVYAVKYPEGEVMYFSKKPENKYIGKGKAYLSVKQIKKPSLFQRLKTWSAPSGTYRRVKEFT